MVALALDRAPAPALPMRHLRFVPAWGVIASALILLQGPSVFASRWAPGTVALVHAFTLGVLGNAMLGALWQFLPVVAGMQPRAMRWIGPWLPPVYNLGVVGLVCGLLRWPALLPWAAVVLAVALVSASGSALAGLRLDGRQTWLRLGLAVVLVALAVAAVLGLVLAFGMSGVWAIALPALTDIHAAVAVVGSVLLLCGTVGSVVVPMFQGTAAVPVRWLGGWIVTLVLAVVLAVAARLVDEVDAMAWLLAAPTAAFAIAVLLLQWRAPRRRNPGLVAFWRWGAFALLAATSLAACAPAWPDQRIAVLVGVLGLGVALPALVLGMWLEIVPFLAWLELQRGRARGAQVPGIDALLPEAAKARLLRLHQLAGVLLIAAAIRPVGALVGVAALVLGSAYVATGRVLFALGKRRRGFAPEPASGAPA